MSAIEKENQGILDLEYQQIELSQRDVRSLIFHFLYAAEAFDYQESLEVLVDNLNRGFDISVSSDDKVFCVASSVINARNELDEQIVPLLHNWRFDRVGVCTKLILRLALWELNQNVMSPNIIINEAIELAKCFAEKDSYKFINGILDEAVKNKMMADLQQPHDALSAQL